MANPVYQAFLLIGPESNFSLEAGVRKLSGTSRWTAEARESGIVVTGEDWEVFVALNESPWVVEESISLADSLDDAPEAIFVSQCERRLEVHSETPDPEMEYFNEFLLIMERLSDFEEVIAVDPHEPGLMFA